MHLLFSPARVGTSPSTSSLVLLVSFIAAAVPPVARGQVSTTPAGGMSLPSDPAEPSTTATISITLQSAPTAPCTVSLTVVNVDAAETAPPTLSPGAVTFTSMDFNMAKPVLVVPTDDAIADGDLGFQVAFTVTGCGTGYDTTPPANIIGKTLDEDVADVDTTAGGGAQTTEAGGTFDITVKLISQPTKPVTVAAIPDDVNTPFVRTEAEASSALVFSALDWNQNKKITIRGVDEAFADGDTSYTIRYTVTSDDPNYNGKAIPGLTALNTDNDKIGVSVSPVSRRPEEANAATAVGKITVVLDSRPTDSVTVVVTNNNPNEGLVTGPPNGAVTFASDAWNVPQTLTALAIDDDVDDDAASWSISYVVSANGATELTGYAGGTITVPDTVVQNVDDDIGGVSVTQPAGTTTSEAGATSTIEVVLNTRPTANVLIQAVAKDATVPITRTEGQIGVDTMTFVPAKWNEVQTFTVAGVDDEYADGDTMYMVDFMVTSTDPVYDMQALAGKTLTNIEDDDTAGVAVGPLSRQPDEAYAATVFGTYTVVLTSRPTAAVTIQSTNQNPESGSVMPTMALTFDGANWDTPQTLTCMAVDEDVDDDGAVWTVTAVAVATTEATGYNGIPVTAVKIVNINDDRAGVLATTPSGFTTDENGGTVVVLVKLQTEPVSPVTVVAAARDATVPVRRAEGIIRQPTFTFTAGDWQTEQTLTVTGQDDEYADGDAAYFVDFTVTGDAKYDGLAVNSVMLLNAEDTDAAGVVVTPILGRPDEAAVLSKRGTFTVMLMSRPSSPVTILLASSNTKEGVIVSSSQLVFTDATWNTPQTVTVAAVDDRIDDDGVRWSVITTATCPQEGTGYDGLAVDDVIIENVDNDEAGVTLVAPEGTISSEAGGTFVIVMALATEPMADVLTTATALPTTAGRTEGTTNGEKVTFTPGNWKLLQTMTVTGVDDPDVDGTQAYRIEIQMTSADGKYDGYFAFVDATNLDNDVARVVVSELNGQPEEANPLVQRGELTVVLNSRPTANVEIIIASSDEAEGTITSASPVVFTPTNWNVPTTVYAAAVDDAVDDDGKTWTITFAVNAVGETTGYDGIMVPEVVVTNVDNDEVAVVPTLSGTRTQEGSTTMLVYYSLNLASQPTGDVVVTAVSSDPSEVVITSQATLTFSSADYNVPQTLTLSGVDDAIDDGDVPVMVSASVTSSSDVKYNALGTRGIPDVQIINLDDADTAGVLVAPAPLPGVIGLRISEDGTTDAFTVVLTSEPAGDVVITLASSNPNAGTVSPAQLVFSPTGPLWSTPQMVVLSPVDDLLDDGDVQFTIDFSDAVSSVDAKYNGMPITSMSAVCLDDDEAGVVAVPGAVSEVDEAGALNATYTVALTAEPIAPVTLLLTVNDPSEGVVVSGEEVVFTMLDWNVPQVVMVRGVDDDVVDGTQAFRVAHRVRSADSAYTSAVTPEAEFTTADDDSYGFTILRDNDPVVVMEGGRGGFRMRLNSQPMATVTVSLGLPDARECGLVTTDVTFSPSDYAEPKLIEVLGVDNDDAAGNGGCMLILNAARSVDLKYNGLDPEDVLIVVQDDDRVGAVVMQIDGELTEGGGTAMFAAMLTSRPTQNVTVLLTSSDTTEAVMLSTPSTGDGAAEGNANGEVVPSVVMVFTADNWDTPQTFHMRGVDDAIDDDRAVFGVVANFSSPGEGSMPTYNGRGMMAVVDLTTVDDDVGGIVVSQITGDTTEDGGTALFTIELLSEPAGEVTIMAKSSDETEGVLHAAMRAAVFTRTNWNVQQTMTVVGVDDRLDDGDIPYSIMLMASAPSEPRNQRVYNNYTFEGPVAVVNEDNDGVGVTLANSTVNTTEQAGRATFHVVLDTRPADRVNVTFSLGDTDEAHMVANKMVFLPATWDTPQTATVTGKDDEFADGDQMFTVTTAVTSRDATYNEIAVHPLAMRNLDDERANVLINPLLPMFEVREDRTRNVTFTVRLTAKPRAVSPVILLESNDTTEGTIAPMSMTFTQETWDIPQSATIRGVDDSVDDGDRVFAINMTFTGDGVAASEYGKVRVPHIHVTNLNDDLAGIAVSALEGGTTEDGGTATFTVRLSSKPDAPVTVPVASTNTNEAVVSPEAVVFTPANWDVPQTIVATGVDDNADDANARYQINVGPATSDDPAYTGASPLSGPVNAVNAKTDDDDDFPWMWVAIAAAVLCLLLLSILIACVSGKGGAKADSFNKEEKEMIAREKEDPLAGSGGIYQPLNDPPPPAVPQASEMAQPQHYHSPPPPAVVQYEDPLATPYAHNGSAVGTAQSASPGYQSGAYVPVQHASTMHSPAPVLYTNGRDGLPGPIEAPRSPGWTPVPLRHGSPSGLVRLPPRTPNSYF